LIDYQCGDEFMEWFWKADRGELDPFVLVVEGSIPNEDIKSEGYWAAFGNNRETGQPITTSEWLTRLAPKATAVLAAGTCATYGGIHAMQGNPTGAMGVPDFLGWDWRSKAGLPVVCVPGCPIQPDNLSETIHYLLQQVAGHAPMIPLDDKLRPTWLFGMTVHEGCDRAGFYEQGEFTKHALHGRAARCACLHDGELDLWLVHPRAAWLHAEHARSGNEVASSRTRAHDRLSPRLVGPRGEFEWHTS
jgi:hydrogenase small subunit